MIFYLFFSFSGGSVYLRESDRTSSILCTSMVSNLEIRIMTFMWLKNEHDQFGFVLMKIELNWVLIRLLRIVSMYVDGTNWF